MNGKVVYHIINEYDPNLVFPSVTLCPKKKEELIYIDVDKFAEDFPKTKNHTSYFIYKAIGDMLDPFEVIQNYSFKLDDFAISSRMSTKFSSSGTFVSPQVYDDALKNFTRELNNAHGFFGTPPFPIAYKEIEDFNGRCFNFQTNEIATLEPQFQGRFN